MMNVYIMGDPSAGRSATSDRTAMAVVGLDSAGNKYLLDGYCHRMKLAERWTKLAQLHRKWKNMPGVQSLHVGYERYGMQTDMEHFEEKMRETGQRFEIAELNWVSDSSSQSKAKRVGRLEPDFRGASFFLPGKVYHPEARDPQTKQLVPARWRILDPDDADDKEIMDTTGGEEFYFQPMLSHHAEERRVLASGEKWRIVDALRRLDEDGNIYDVTRLFFEEFRFFPFSPHDDLIDAVSRIYDMKPMPAIRHETFEVADYPDA
jgi:hypothetical protein